MQINLKDGAGQERDPRRLRVPGIKTQMGLGDVIAAATDRLGIEKCSPCEERRRKLNGAVQLSPWQW